MNMTRGWFSVAFACAFGALIGTLTALEISARLEYGSYLWAIGALVGGIVAYVAIDFRHFCTGVVHSYRRTIAWRPHLLWWKTFAILSGAIVMIYSSIIGIGGVVVACFSDNPMSVIINTFWLMLVFWVAGAGLSWLMVGSTSSDARDVADCEQRLRNVADVGRRILIYRNPIIVTLAILRGLKWVVVHTLSAIARAVPASISGMCHVGRMIAQFVTGVFVYVHSQRRMICFVDATIGAAVGYSFGSAIIGAIAGMLLGIINYEVVSVRWLRLVPASR